MPRLRTVGWLVMMWLVSGMAGFTLAFGFTSGAPALGILALFMSIGVLAGSLLPLSAGLSLWDDGGGGGRRGPVRVPVDFGSSSSSASRRPAFGGFAGLLGVTSTPPPSHNGIVATVHEAAAARGDSQICARCGVVLSADGPFDGSPSSGKTWPPGAWVAEWERRLYPLEPRALEEGEGFCSAQRTPASWATASPRPDDPAASA